MKDLNRTIRMLCPTCGNDLFSIVGSDINEITELPEDTVQRSLDRHATFTKAELVSNNQGIINANIDEVKNEVIKEVEKELTKALRKLR